MCRSRKWKFLHIWFSTAIALPAAFSHCELGFRFFETMTPISLRLSFRVLRLAYYLKGKYSVDCGVRKPQFLLTQIREYFSCYLQCCGSVSSRCRSGSDFTFWSQSRIRFWIRIPKFHTCWKTWKLLFVIVHSSSSLHCCNLYLSLQICTVFLNFLEKSIV